MKPLIILTLTFTIHASSQYFTKIQEGPQSNDGGDSRSVNWIDYDNDGDIDLFITNGPSSKANNFLYKNNGSGTFSKVTDISLVNDPGSYDGSSWADYDNDGYIDAFSVTWYGQKNSLHRQRKGVFEKVTGIAPSADNTFSETASWGDYDNDGYVDLYVANSSGVLANILYSNNRNGTFTKVTTGPLVNNSEPTRSVDWCDFDNDGDLDLFTANEGNFSEALYWNLGGGNFVAESGTTVVSDAGNSFGSSVADIDNDGDMDILVVNHGNQNEALFLNNGNKTFAKVTSDPVVNSGGYSVGSAFGDLDNDGDLDLMVTNAFAGSSPTKNFLYLNNGNGTFVKIDTGIVANDPGWSYGVAFGDYDRDGDLDIATANCFGANQNNALYRNEGNKNAWLTVKAVGKVSNGSAIGAKVKVKATINGVPKWQYRQVSGQSGYCGQNLESHFGLGNAAVIDSLVVEFPSGQKSIQTNITPKQFLTVTENVPAGFFRGSLQIDSYEGMAPMTVSFADLSLSHTSQPVSSWKWDVNDDGIIDGTASTLSFQYTQPDTYSITLIVGNGIVTDTVIAKNAVVITPSAAIILFNTATHNFGTIDVNVPQKDTTVMVYNIGKLTDSLSVSLVYGSTSPSTVKPDSALKVHPSAFVLAPNDSQAVTFTIYPPKVIRTNLNIIYTPKIVLTSKFNVGVKTMEKPMWVKLQGTLVAVQEYGANPRAFELGQNYPNPFNPTTTIRFDLPDERFVDLRLYDSIGREIRKIINEVYPSGRFSVIVNAGQLSSGTYFYRLQAGTDSDIKKLMVVK